ncbi:hypothetical protein HYX02_05005 [Candidatus Woesearchaeota archaeon]|nr:hypothetical protein [Candidatus Woesearchaeota archaeon]
MKSKKWWQARYFGERIYTPYEYLYGSGVSIIVIGIIFLLITIFINLNIKNLIFSGFIIFLGLAVVVILKILKKIFVDNKK